MKASYTSRLADAAIAAWPPTGPTNGNAVVRGMAMAWICGRVIAARELEFQRGIRLGPGLPDIAKQLTKVRTALDEGPDRDHAEKVVRQAVLDCGLAGYVAALRASGARAGDPPVSRFCP